VADSLLTARELGAVLSMSTAWVLDEWEAGRLPGFKLGDGRAAPVRFRLSEVEAWLETRRRGPAVSRVASVVSAP
jgi:predicted DNA-binding transcriptional regulator AlpA